MNLSGIPDELKDLAQWVCWKSDKHPRTPTGEHASTSDPTTWSPFDKVRGAIHLKKAVGPGFVFSEDDPYAAIDLDKVIDDNGDIDLDAQAIIDKLDSYTEISQSGRGIHIIVRATKSNPRCRKDNVEIYNCKRYFAITGELWQDRDAINDRQEELEWLCSDVFECRTEGARPVGDLVLDAGANPPRDKLKQLLRKKEFRKVWEHRDEDLQSLSDYDWRLVLYAVDEGFGDQEIADLIIAFRREHGDDDDIKKSLRADYIPMTIGKARSSIIDEEGILNLLPFKVRRVLQYGLQDSEYELELIDGRRVPMGVTDSFLSPRKAEAKLYDAGFITTDKMVKRWKQIVRGLMPFVERVHTVTREEGAKSWMDDYINARISLPVIEAEGDIGKMFGSGLNSIATDKRGRIYLRLSDITRYVRVHTGLGGVSTKTVAHDLISLGFGKRKVYVTEEGRRKQISIWVSPVGFVDSGE